jgi:sugar phosphate permease
MLAVALAAQVGCSYVHQGLAALAPLFQTEWALSRAEVGGVVSAMNWGVLLASVLAGQLVDRLGERPMLVAGPLGVGLLVLAASLSPTPLVLGACLGGAGVFLAANSPAGAKAMVAWFPPRQRGFAMGVRQTAVPLAGALAAATLPWLATPWGWRGALVAGGLLALATALTALTWYRDPPQAGPAHSPTGWATIPQLLADRSLLATLLLGPVLVAGQWSVVSYLGLYLYERFAWPVALAASFLALAHAGGVVGRLALGIASDTLAQGRRKPVLALVPPLGALGVLALALLPPTTPPLVVGGVALALGATVIGWNGVHIIYLAEQAGPHRAGTALGLALLLLFASGVAVPPLFGSLVDRLGSYQPVWLLLAGLLLAALGLIPWMREPARA